MKMKCFGIALLTSVALALSPTWALAQAAGKKELVQKIVELQRPGVEVLGRQLAEQPAIQIVQSVRRIIQARVPADKRDAASKAADAEVRKYLDETVPALQAKAVELAPSTLGVMLEEKFSEDELRQLLAWLESPVSRKFAQLAPDLNAALAQKLVEQTKSDVEPRIQRLDAAIARQLGLPPAQPPAAAASAPAKK